jgi:2,3-bisphosphoglycerate-independent phosphoglycerate mutase
MQRVIGNCINEQVPLHLLGLLSDGNIHSHISHFEALIQHAFSSGVKKCYVHALLDGRDVPVQSATEYTDKLEMLFQELMQQNPECDYAFASGGGRETVTMDRDTNWNKVELGWKVHVNGESENQFPSIKDAIEHFRLLKPDIIDQDLPEFVITRNGKPVGPIEDRHSMVFMNFRADRAIEFTEAMLKQDFSHFPREPLPRVCFAAMTQYDLDNCFPEYFLAGTPKVENPFGKRLVEKGLNQFRLTETQKFPHVTFFYNGGYREPLDSNLEKYHLIPSDKVSSFAEAPKMKAVEIGKEAVDFIRSENYQYGLINFANADMVGHTGNLKAAVSAVESVDQALGPMIEALDTVNGIMVITADHGNADEMLTINHLNGETEPSTKHSINPVPFLIYDPLYDGSYQLKAYGENCENNLSQVAATNFILMGMEVPDDLAPPLFL